MTPACTADVRSHNYEQLEVCSSIEKGHLRLLGIPLAANRSSKWIANQIKSADRGCLWVKCTNHTAIAHEIDLHFVRNNFFLPMKHGHLKEHTLPSPNPTAKNMGEHSWIGLCLMNLKPYCAHKVQTSLAYSAEKKRIGKLSGYTVFFVWGYYIKALGTAAQIQKCVDTWKKFFNSNRLFAVVARNPSGTHFRIHYVLRLPILRCGGTFQVPGSPQFTRTHYGCFQE